MMIESWKNFQGEGHGRKNLVDPQVENLKPEYEAGDYLLRGIPRRGTRPIRVPRGKFQNSCVLQSEWFIFLGARHDIQR